MIKKIFVITMSLLMVFTQVPLSSSAKSNTDDIQKLNIDGQKVEVFELNSGENGFYSYEFVWEDGSVEELEIQELDDGKAVAKAVDTDGKVYHLERDKKGDVYIDGVLSSSLVPDELLHDDNGNIGNEVFANPSPEQTDLIEVPAYMDTSLQNGVGIQSFDPGGGSAGSQGFKHISTRTTSVHGMIGTVSLVAGLIAMKVNLALSIFIPIAGWFITKKIKDTYIRTQVYQKVERYNTVHLERVSFFRVSNFTGFIRTVDYVRYFPIPQ